MDFGVPRRGAPAAIRPAVVVTASALLAFRLEAVNVVPCTTAARGWETEVPTEWGTVQCHAVTTVSVDDIVEQTAKNVGPAVLAQVREVLADLLDIG
ncbi:MAG: type II toxin-antitoxin system PemK/MazF family toxin [Ilumatobacteraceae bacterium]